jgi:hypothetical protein
MGSQDWNYPFSLCASLYRLGDVHELLSQMQLLYGGLTAFSHPNRLEVLGNLVATQGSRAKGATVTTATQAEEYVDGLSAPFPSLGAESAAPPAWLTHPSRIVPLASRRPWSACLSQPTVVAVTVNRVQDLYANPVYAQQEGGEERGEQDTHMVSSSAPSAPSDLSADGLLHLWQRHPSLSFDLPRYGAAASSFRSVHVGDFFIQAGETDDDDTHASGRKESEATG